jgi:hypothetical protein
MLGRQQRADRQSTIADVAFNQPGNPEIERRGATLLCAARTGEILRIEPCDGDRVRVRILFKTCRHKSNHQTRP